MEQQVCLRWNNYHSSLASTLEFMWDEESLVDVTLFCEGQEIRAHKVVLSACSSLFKTLLKSNSCPHPIIILHSISLCDLEAILQFIYKGHVNIEQKQLNRLLQTATSLQIRGLAGIAEREKVDQPDQETQEPPLKKPKKTPTASKTTIVKKKLSKANHVNSEEHHLITPKEEPLSDDDENLLGAHQIVHETESGNELNGEETDSLNHTTQPTIKQLEPSRIENSSHESQTNSNQGFTCRNSQFPPYPCPFCCRAYTSWGFRRRHIKAMHTLSPELSCKWCSIILPSRDSWENHVVSQHQLSKSEAEQGLTVLEEAHMVLQNPHPTRLNTLVDMVNESQSQSVDKD